MLNLLDQIAAWNQTRRRARRNRRADASWAAEIDKRHRTWLQVMSGHPSRGAR